MNHHKIIDDYVKAYFAYNGKMPVLEALRDRVVLMIDETSPGLFQEFSYEDIRQMAANLWESYGYMVRSSLDGNHRNRTLLKLSRRLASVNISEVMQHGTIQRSEETSG